MKVRVEDCYARCPYCGSMDFLEGDDSGAGPQELECERCGGYASRKLLLDRIGDEAIAQSKESLARLKSRPAKK